jgi:hypothetical protein
MTNDANHKMKPETLAIIKKRVDKVESKMKNDNLDAQAACKELHMRFDGYKRDKKLLGEELKDTQQTEQEITMLKPLSKPSITNTEIPPQEESQTPPQEPPQEFHRVSVDLPDDVYKYIVYETMRTPFKIKAISEHIIIEHVRDKEKKGERLI